MSKNQDSTKWCKHIIRKRGWGGEDFDQPYWDWEYVHTETSVPFKVTECPICGAKRPN